MEKLKKWSKKDLRKEDWDFSGFAKLPKATINRIFLWELDLELVSGQGSFLSYRENRDYLAKARKSDPCLEESDKSPNGDKLSTSHQFRVNWAANKPDLMTAFLNWLESSSAPHSAFPCKSWADRATSLRCWRKSRPIVSSRRIIRAVRSFSARRRRTTTEKTCNASTGHW